MWTSRPAAQRTSDTDAAWAWLATLPPAQRAPATTRLVLVNALFLKAPWRVPFPKRETTPGRFTTAAGRPITVPMMSGDPARGYVRASGWTATTLPYLGDELAMALVLPDPAGTTAVRDLLSGPQLTELLRRLARATSKVAVKLPRFTIRSRSLLKPALTALGMGAAFAGGADFTGMLREPVLQIEEVPHEAVVAVDEEGTRASAATAVVVGLESGPAGRLVLDRPFYVVIYDVATLVPLFFARVADPGDG